MRSAAPLLAIEIPMVNDSPNEISVGTAVIKATRSTSAGRVSAIGVPIAMLLFSLLSWIDPLPSLLTSNRYEPSGKLFESGS